MHLLGPDGGPNYDVELGLRPPDDADPNGRPDLAARPHLMNLCKAVCI